MTIAAGPGSSLEALLAGPPLRSRPMPWTTFPVTQSPTPPLAHDTSASLPCDGGNAHDFALLIYCCFSCAADNADTFVSSQNHRCGITPVGHRPTPVTEAHTCNRYATNNKPSRIEDNRALAGVISHFTTSIKSMAVHSEPCLRPACKCPCIGVHGNNSCCQRVKKRLELSMHHNSICAFTATAMHE